MKVLMICGSPHSDGCTRFALSAIDNELTRQGIETALIQLGSDPVQGCIGCESCRGSGGGKCVFDDNVNRALELMTGCDALIVGSPVYFASPNGALLSFLDRMFYAGARSFSHKLGACIVSARRGGTTAALDALNKYFLYAQMPIVSSQYWNMVHGNTPQEVACDLEGLQIMRTLGRNMAWLLKSVEAGRRAGVELPEREKRVATNFIRL